MQSFRCSSQPSLGHYIAMTESELIRKTKDAYLELVHPASEDYEHSQSIVTLLDLAPTVSDDVVSSMIAGPSWRERLLGLSIAMTKERQPASYIENMFQSLRDPRGLAIVPTAAALASLARRGAFTMTPSFGEQFDHNIFSGEVGWAVTKAMHFAGLISDDAVGVAPNNGQVFEDHLQLYDFIRAA